MPNIKSAKKRVLVSQAANERNTAMKSNLRTAIKHYKLSLSEDTKGDSKELLVKAIRTIDKAASKGLIHKKNASRKKARLAQMYNKAKAKATA